MFIKINKEIYKESKVLQSRCDSLKLTHKAGVEFFVLKIVSLNSNIQNRNVPNYANIMIAGVTNK